MSAIVPYASPSVQNAENQSDLVYDESFMGFLTAVFCAYEYKIEFANIQRQSHVQPTLYSSSQEVVSDADKAARVWDGLVKKIGNKHARTIYVAFLSELPEVENLLLRAIRYVFGSDKNVSKDYSHPDMLKVSQICKMVGREKHRMEAFVRFKLTKDEIYFSRISPDFDVLPLLQTHFTDRYADQKWLIYDEKRRYGLYYDLHQSGFIEISFDAQETSATGALFHEDEHAFEELWKNYFKSTNIASRKNTRLHLRHVPKRYWKYLSEKDPF